MRHFVVFMVTEGHEREVCRKIKKHPLFCDNVKSTKIPLRTVHKTVRHRKSSSTKEVREIAFPGYVFVELIRDRYWPLLMDCQFMLLALVAEDGTPHKVGEDVLSQIPAIDKTVRKKLFKKGQEVIITDGIFRGKFGKMLNRNVVEIEGLDKKVRLPANFLALAKTK
jgi:transcription antitermination factor NusG